MAFISLIKAAFSEQRFAHVGMETQINIHTHVHFLENNFSIPDVCPQLAFCRLWTHAWFKNIFRDQLHSLQITQKIAYKGNKLSIVVDTVHM